MKQTEYIPKWKKPTTISKAEALDYVKQDLLKRLPLKALPEFSSPESVHSCLMFELKFYNVHLTEEVGVEDVKEVMVKC